MLAHILVLLFVGCLLGVAVLAPGRAVSETAERSIPLSKGLLRNGTSYSAVSLTAPAPRLYRGRPATYWASLVRFRTRQLQQARRALHARWQPTVTYALRLASAVFGVSYWELRSVAWCESRHNPFATNGRYKGLMQLSWAPFGMDPYDPVANALSAAQTVAHDGSWGQWECKP